MPKSGIGTAFSIDENGTWLTARHVVDGCDEVGLNIGRGQIIAAETSLSQKSDIGVLKTKWHRKAMAHDIANPRRVGEHGFFIGFPQGRPGEAIGQLIGRNKMRISGRYKTEETVLAWAELGRTRGLKGSLGGMSGGPVLDADGEVIGIVAAESPRRGRIYSVAPQSMQGFVPKANENENFTLEDDTFGLHADKLRRERRITQVICIVKDS
ncbi:MAG: S1 family peptidase [Maricaulaceae bacterium]